MAKRERSWVGITVSNGRYELLSLLGGGAMGSVYLANDRNLDTEVAVKIPLESMLQDPDFAPRFDREIRVLVKLRHSHIVKLYDVGIEEGFPYMIMELYRGGDLEDRRPKRADGTRGAVSPASLSAWLPEIAGALDYAHGKGYIHRDIKPTNILFDEANHAYLADFGVVGAMANTPAASTRAMTAAGLVVGTPEYMAPEIIMGEPFDGRADQYSLAIMVYELLAGRRPFEGTNATALIVQQSTQPPPPLRDLAPHVTESLARVVHRGLEKQPLLRFENCAAFARGVVAEAAGIELRPTEEVVTSEVQRVPCPGCGTSLKLIAKYAGKRLKCPTCKIIVRVMDDLSLKIFEESATYETVKMNPGTPPPLAVAGTPPKGTTKLPIDTTSTESKPAPSAKPRSGKRELAPIIGGVAFGVLGIAFLSYFVFSSRTNPPEITISVKPVIPQKVVQIKKLTPPLEAKRPSRVPLPDELLVSEEFATDDIEEGKLPEGWEGDLRVVKKQGIGPMELSMAKDQEVGSVTLSFPENRKIYGDFECRVRFLLPEITSKNPEIKDKTSYFTFSLTNSPGIDQDLIVEIGSTHDFGRVKVFQKPSDAEETVHEMVDRFPTDRASELILRRKSDKYEVSINGVIVGRMKFPKYHGTFERANLKLKTHVSDKLPHILSVRVKAEREPPIRDFARISPSRPVPEPARPRPEATAPAQPIGFRVDFAESSLNNWTSGSLAELKRYAVRKDDKALALTSPGLDLVWPFIDHAIDPPITGDFRLGFDLKIPNVDSEFAIRLRTKTEDLVTIEIHGNDSFSLVIGKDRTDTTLTRVKANNRNGFELRQDGGRLKFSVEGTSLLSISTELGAVSIDRIGVRLSTDHKVVRSPLLYSLDLQPLNP